MTTDTIETFDQERFKANCERAARELRIEKGDHFEVLMETPDGVAWKMTATSAAVIEQMVADKRKAGVPEDQAQVIGPWAALCINQVCRAIVDVRTSMGKLYDGFITPPGSIDASGPNGADPINGIHEWAFAINAYVGWLVEVAMISIGNAHKGDDMKSQVDKAVALGRLSSWSTKSALAVGERLARYQLGTEKPGSTVGRTLIVAEGTITDAEARTIATAVMGGLRGKSGSQANN